MAADEHGGHGAQHDQCMRPAGQTGDQAHGLVMCTIRAVSGDR